jgi:hypothetical protein
MRLKVYPEQRPDTRGECADMPRPCPFISCKWHLAHGPISPHAKPPLGDDEAVDLIVGMRESCALDVADRGDHTESDVAEFMSSTRQAVADTQRHMRRRLSIAHDFQDWAEDVSSGREPFDLWAPGGDRYGPREK